MSVRPPLRPVDEVMGMETSGSAATREPAAAVSLHELAVKPSRDGPRRPPDPDESVITVEDELNPTVTSQPPRGLRCDRCAIVELGRSVDAIQRGRLNVNDDRRPIGIGVVGDV